MPLIYLFIFIVRCCVSTGAWHLVGIFLNEGQGNVGPGGGVAVGGECWIVAWLGVQEKSEKSATATLKSFRCCPPLSSVSSSSPLACPLFLSVSCLSAKESLLLLLLLLVLPHMTHGTARCSFAPLFVLCFPFAFPFVLQLQLGASVSSPF